MSKLISVPYELHVPVHVFLRIQLDNHFNDTCLIQFDFAPEKAETVYEYSSFVGFFFYFRGWGGVFVDDQDYISYIKPTCTQQ